MSAQVAPSGECLRGKGPPNWMLAKTLAAPSVSALNLVVAAALRVSVCCIPCDKVERFVLIIIKRRLFIILNLT